MSDNFTVEYELPSLSRATLTAHLIAVAVCVWRRRETFGSVQYCDDITGPGGLVRHRHCCYTERVWSAAAAAASKASFACSRAIGLEYDAAAGLTTAAAAIKHLDSGSSGAASVRSSAVTASLRTSAVAAGLRGKLAKVTCAQFGLAYCLYMNVMLSHLP
jgi:hypothetical protein